MLVALRRVLIKFQRSRACVWTIFIPDMIIAKLMIVLRLRSANPQGCVVLATAGRGNIGDQAMLEALIRHTEGPIRIVMKDAEDFCPFAAKKDVRISVLPKLTDAYPLERVANSIKLAKHLAAAERYIVIGADVMDGLYYPTSSVSRFSSLIMARRLGLEARLVGFSWSSHAEKSSLTAYRFAVKQGVEAYPRDPISTRRIKQHGTKVSGQAADLVFSTLDVESSATVIERITQCVNSKRPVAVVNVSGLLGGRTNQSIEYLEIINQLQSMGYFTIFLPHVIRQGDDDLPELRKLVAIKHECQDRTLSENYLLVSELLRPVDVRAICKLADVVITGRMHLAIMSLSQGTPAITLGTQGKVEGLYELFELPQLCVEPVQGFGKQVVELLRTEDLQGCREQILDALPVVRSLSERNFA